VVPPGSLVRGSPAKVVGPVRDKDRVMIEGGWRTYVAYSAQYKARLESKATESK
jgi:carbonic anhydrase/acetyltransferase-like protein (isoleucine patch superfamily)